MSTRLNYTGRKRILREHAKLAVHLDGDTPAIFDADLDLTSYMLPEDARVVVEATRQTSWMRFDFGTVGALKPPAERRLTLFGTGQAISFRVKVIEPVNSTAPPRILAHADRIRPRLTGDSKKRAESLLVVEWGRDLEFKHLPWRLDFDEETEPILRVSYHIIRNRDGFVTSSEFVSLALPQIFRAILERIVNIDPPAGAPEDIDWRRQWMKFATLLPGVPSIEFDDAVVAEKETWIDHAVSGFCRKARIGKSLGEWLGNED